MYWLSIPGSDPRRCGHGVGMSGVPWVMDIGPRSASHEPSLHSRESTLCRWVALSGMPEFLTSRHNYDAPTDLRIDCRLENECSCPDFLMCFGHATGLLMQSQRHPHPTFACNKGISTCWEARRMNRLLRRFLSMRVTVSARSLSMRVTVLQ